MYDAIFNCSVFCWQEPLRVALSSHLRSLIQNLNNNSESTEQIGHILINDNLDLGCALIETVATRKVSSCFINFAYIPCNRWHFYFYFLLP